MSTFFLAFVKISVLHFFKLLKRAINMLAMTEKTNKRTWDIDLQNGEKIAELINNEDKKVARAVEKIVPEIGTAIDEAANLLLAGGRMAYFGAGTSGRIGILDASEIPPTFGAAADKIQAYIAGGDKAIRFAVEKAEDSERLAQSDFKKFNPSDKDVVVGVSAGGTPRYVIKVLELARSKGVLTIGISSNPVAPLRQYSDIFLNPVVGPEAITGSSRLKAGTAQKMILNMLSTGVMIKLGKTYHNYMIDLEITNMKLQRRAVRFIREITGADEAAAECVLKIAGNVKTACVMLVLGYGKEDAERLLREKGGILRRIL